MEISAAEPTSDAWFVYDGECPLCSAAAHALRIRRAVGELHLVDARTHRQHPLLREIQRRGLDLDQGMVIYFGEHYYHGADALHLMAMLSTGQGWFNRLNAALFRHKRMAVLCYPPMRATRNLLLRIKGIDTFARLRE